MKIATWNVNSIKMREDHILDWLEAHEPDVLCLQETKISDQEFPEDGLLDLDYEVEYFGQRSYNGVAIASRAPMSNVVRGFNNASDSDDKRLIAATIEGVRVVCIYLPNGQAVGSDKYNFKLSWMEQLRAFLEEESSTEPLVLAGDYNIAPQVGDHFSAAPDDDHLFVSKPELDRYRALLDWGLT
ncbi:MAG: exodeoxyribonuclease III, partial [Myxococcota bacterium]